MSPRRRLIGRLWRGRAMFANAHLYQEHLRKETLPALGDIDGFHSAYVLRRACDDDVEFLVLTFWASRNAIRAFAGRDAERAVIPPAAARLLTVWDERASHYDIALSYEQS